MNNHSSQLQRSVSSLDEISELFHKAAMAAAPYHEDEEAPSWWVPPLESIASVTTYDDGDLLNLMTPFFPSFHDFLDPQNNSESCLEMKNQNNLFSYSALTPMPTKPVYVFSTVTVTKSEFSSSSSSSSSQQYFIEPRDYLMPIGHHDFPVDSYYGFFNFSSPFEDFDAESHILSVAEETKPMIMPSTLLMNNYQNENFVADISWYSPRQNSSFLEGFEEVSDDRGSLHHLGSEF